MQRQTSGFSYPYPHNLMCEVMLEDIPEDKLPPDYKESVEYVLENLMDQRESFMLVLKFMRGMSNHEIGTYFGLTTQRARQVIEKAMRRLRHPSRYTYLRHGIAQKRPLPQSREDRPPLGAVLKEVDIPDIWGQKARKKVCQIQLLAEAEHDLHPQLQVDGTAIQAGRSYKVRLPSGWQVVTFEIRQEITGPDCWHISTPGYTHISPVGLFVEI